MKQMKQDSTLTWVAILMIVNPLENWRPALGRPLPSAGEIFIIPYPAAFCQVEICTNFILFLSHYLCNIFYSTLLQFSVSVLYYNCSKGTGRAYWTGGRQATTSPLRDRPKKL